MLIVGELINASRKQIGAAIKNQDKDTIQQVVNNLVINHIPLENISVDPLVQTLSTNDN